MANDQGKPLDQEHEREPIGVFDRPGEAVQGELDLRPGTAATGEQSSESASGEGPPTVPADADDRDSFTAELARAMGDVVARERARIAEDLARRQEHLDAIRATDAAEEQRLRRTAADETTAIQAWADAETRRIQREAEGRLRAVRKELEASLASHRAAFDGAIGSTETAIATYRTQVEAWSAALDGETDVVRIAREATKRPAFPKVEPMPGTTASTAAPASTARASTASEAAARRRQVEIEPIEPEAPVVAEQPTEPEVPVVAEQPTEPAEAPAARGPAAAEPSHPEPGVTGPAPRPRAPQPGMTPEGSPARSGTLLQSVPVVRPMTIRLGGDAEADEDDDRTRDDEASAEPQSPAERVSRVLARLDRRRPDGPR